MKSYEPFLPSYKSYESERDKSRWGFNSDSWGTYGGVYGNNFRNFDKLNGGKYLPPKTDHSKDWGRYGGNYGNGGNFIYVGFKDNYDYWGLNNKNDFFNTKRPSPTYLPEKRPEIGITYLPASHDHGHEIPFGRIPLNRLDPPKIDGFVDGHTETGTQYPPKTFDRPGYDFVKERKE